MLLIIGIIFVILRLLGFTIFHITKRFIHILLVIAIIMIVLGIIGRM